MPLTIEIITPEKTVFTDTVDEVILPTKHGKTGILPRHIPMITQLVAGDLEVVRGGTKEYLAVDQGFAQVASDKVSILTEAAIEVADIDLSSVESAEQAAKEALEKAQAEGADPSDIERLHTQFENIARFAIAQRLAKKR